MDDFTSVAIRRSRMSEMERHYPHVPKARIIELALKELEKKLQSEERLSAEPVQAACGGR